MALYDGTAILACAKTVSTTVGETFLPLPNGAKAIIFDKVTTTNASADLSSSTSTFGVYSATAGGGTAIVTAATGTLTPLSAATKFKDCTVALSGDTFTPSVQTSGTYLGQCGVFLHVAGTNNVAATFDVYVQGRILT